MNPDKFKSVAINIKTYKKLEELSKQKFELPISMAKTVEYYIEKGSVDKSLEFMQLHAGDASDLERRIAMLSDVHKVKTNWDEGSAKLCRALQNLMGVETVELIEDFAEEALLFWRPVVLRVCESDPGGTTFAEFYEFGPFDAVGRSGEIPG